MSEGSMSTGISISAHDPSIDSASFVELATGGWHVCEFAGRVSECSFDRLTSGAGTLTIEVLIDATSIFLTAQPTQADGGEGTPVTKEVGTTSKDIDIANNKFAKGDIIHIQAKEDGAGADTEVNVHLRLLKEKAN